MYSKLRTAACVVAAGIVGMTAAQDTIPFNFGIAPGLSYRKTDNAVVNFSANLIYSRNLSVAGADFAGFVSNVSNLTNGYQAAGLVSTTQELNGFQAAGIYSGVEGNAMGFQAGGLIGRIGGNLRGIQSAGLINHTSGDVFGGQSGVVNVAQNVTGFQAGFVNISRNLNGVPFGLINITGNGNVSAIAYATNFSGGNVGAKFIANNFVTTITVGGYDYEEQLDTAVSVATSWGYHIPLEPFYVEVDIANYDMVQLEDLDVKNPLRRHLTALRLTAGWDVADFLGIFAGAGAGYELELEGEDIVADNFKPLYYGGVTLF
ncbi:MAG: hypothetical protein ACLFQB_12395 [Chitinispirillaceae bacterium]